MHRVQYGIALLRERQDSLKTEFLQQKTNDFALRLRERRWRSQTYSGFLTGV
jgi:hypothetical protein